METKYLSIGNVGQHTLGLQDTTVKKPCSATTLAL